MILSFDKKKWGSLIIKFIGGQASLQIINVLAGFLLLRWLSIEEYAQFTFAMVFFTTTNLLVDSGFTTAIISLTGESYKDKEIVGKYVKSAKFFRNILFLIVMPISAYIFIQLSFQHDWNLFGQVIFMISMVAIIYAQGIMGIYSAPLQMHQSLKALYQPQLISSAIKILINGALFFSKVFNGYLAFVVQTIAMYFNSYFIKKGSENLVIEPNNLDYSVKKEMFYYLAPQLPQVVFYALQGQVVYLAITYFGKTEDIAGVGALSRLQQIFSLFGPFFFIVLQPIFARKQAGQLLKLFWFILFIILIFLLLVFGFSLFFPFSLIWILGEKYFHLSNEIPLVILSGCISVLGVFFYMVQISRKWIFWWGNILYIVLMTATILLFIFIVGISTVHDAVLFGFFQSITFSSVYLIVLIVGFFKK